MTSALSREGKKVTINHMSQTERQSLQIEGIGVTSGQCSTTESSYSTSRY